jgi:hypothetical protein
MASGEQQSEKDGEKQSKMVEEKNKRALRKRVREIQALQQNKLKGELRLYRNKVPYRLTGEGYGGGV